MSLMNYGFTKSTVDSADLVSESKRQESGMEASQGKSPNKSKSPLKPDSKEKLQKLKSPKSTGTPKPKNSPKTTPPKSLQSTSKLPKVIISPIKVTTKSNSSSNGGVEYSPFGPRKSTDLCLPPQRVKMIMKSCPDVEIVPQEALHLVTKATELFIQHLVQTSLSSSNDKSKLDYDALSNLVHCTENMEFLKETIPKKITWEECKKIIASKKGKMEDLV